MAQDETERTSGSDGREGCDLPLHSSLFVTVRTDDDGSKQVYGVVRTTSWSFAGERTDLHDVLSALFAVLLRVVGNTSVRLIDRLNPGFCRPGELYARNLIIDQSPSPLGPIEETDTIWSWLSFQTHTIAHELSSALDVETQNSPTPTYEEPAWTAKCRSVVGKRSSEVISTIRREPTWKYLRFARSGISVTELSEVNAEGARSMFSQFAPDSSDGRDRWTIRTGSVLNAVPQRTMTTARRLIAAVEGTKATPIVVPIESHVIALGWRTLVVIPEDCGIRAYDEEYEKVAARRAAEAAVFLPDTRCEWAESIDDGRLQQLVLELLEADPTVSWVREVGTSRDRDGGRDLIAEWDVGPERTRGAIPKDEPLIKRRHVIVQVKCHTRTVGKSHVRDVRDTLEHFEADGFLLVALPQVSSALLDHLVKLRQRADLWIDWWDRPQVDRQLRRHQDVAARFTDLVRLVR